MYYYIYSVVIQLVICNYTKFITPTRDNTKFVWKKLWETLFFLRFVNENDFFND